MPGMYCRTTFNQKSDKENDGHAKDIEEDSMMISDSS